MTWPAEAPAVEHTTHGFQYLTESRFDQVDPILEVLRKTMQALGMPLLSLEVELGPSQYEFTFAPERGLASADTMVLFPQRHEAGGAAARLSGELHVPAEIAQYVRQRLASPPVSAGPEIGPQSVRSPGARTNRFSPLGQHYLAGLLAHARAAAAFTTPTINGYKRYHGVNSMAPIQAIWASDNRGVMIRVLGAPGDPSTHLENRVGEPLASPYLYMARRRSTQASTVLRASSRRGRPRMRRTKPSAEPLPKSMLAEALAALKDSVCFRTGFGDVFIDYHLSIKAAEIARCDAEASGHRGNAAEVSVWEHKEYFDLA